MLPRLGQQAGLNGLHQPLTVPGEELDLILGGLVGSQQAVVLIAPAAVYRGVHNLVQTEHLFPAGGQQAALGAGSGVDVTAQHVFGVGQDGAGVVGKENLHLRAALPDELGVIVHIVHPGKGVLVVSEERPVALQGEYILIGIYSLLVHQVQVHQMVAHLVGGVGEQQHDFLGALGNAPQADGKAVAAEDGEENADGLSPQLGPHVGGDVLHRGVIALGPGHDGLRHGDDIPVTHGKAVLTGGLQHGSGDNLHQIVPASDDGGANAS